MTSPPHPSALQFLTLERSDMDENYGRVVANIFPQKKQNQTKPNRMFLLKFKGFCCVCGLLKLYRKARTQIQFSIL